MNPTPRTTVEKTHAVRTLVVEEYLPEMPLKVNLLEDEGHPLAAPGDHEREGRWSVLVVLRRWEFALRTAQWCERCAPAEAGFIAEGADLVRLALSHRDLGAVPTPLDELQPSKLLHVTGRH
jgi:hypothetical protein